MNRAEWKRQQKKDAKRKQKEAHVMTNYEKGRSVGMAEGYRHGLKYAAANCNRLLMTAVAATLRDEYRFGHDRMERFLNITLATLQDIADDPDREQKLRDWIQKEIGINLDDHTGCRWLDIAEDMGLVVEGAMVQK